MSISVNLFFELYNEKINKWIPLYIEDKNVNIIDNQNELNKQKLTHNFNIDFNLLKYLINNFDYNNFDYNNFDRINNKDKDDIYNGNYKNIKNIYYQTLNNVLKLDYKSNYSKNKILSYKEYLKYKENKEYEITDDFEHNMVILGEDNWNSHNEKDKNNLLKRDNIFIIVKIIEKYNDDTFYNNYIKILYKYALDYNILNKHIRILISF